MAAAIRTSITSLRVPCSGAEPDARPLRCRAGQRTLPSVPALLQMFSPSGPTAGALTGFDIHLFSTHTGDAAQDLGSRLLT